MVSSCDSWMVFVFIMVVQNWSLQLRHWLFQGVFLLSHQTKIRPSRSDGKKHSWLMLAGFEFQLINHTRDDETTKHFVREDFPQQAQRKQSNWYVETSAKLLSHTPLGQVGRPLPCRSCHRACCYIRRFVSFQIRCRNSGNS